MKRSSRLFTIPARLWRRRGHGVHSPFAYYFLRQVVAQPYAYYAYPDIKRLAHSAGVSASLARLLYRLCLHVCPVRVCLAGSGAPELAAIVGSLLPRRCPAPVCAPIVADGGVAMLVGDAVRDALPLWKSLPHGMLFRGSSAAVIVAFPRLYHQKFDIWI